MKILREATHHQQPLDTLAVLLELVLYQDLDSLLQILSSPIDSFP